MPVLPPLPTGDLDHVLAHTQGLWEELRGKSLFITGGTGFFGHWLLESFIHANDVHGLGARATLLSRDPAAFKRKSPHLTARPDLNWITGDVREFTFPQGEFQYVIHAGTTSSAPVAPLEMFDVIVQGTRRVLDFAVHQGTRKLLFLSSGAVYGTQPPDMTHIPEEYSGAPASLDSASAYGEGKRAAELLCALTSQKHGFEGKIARCFAFVGPHLPLDSHFAIGNFIRDALRGGPIRVGGDGTPYRSYLYAADLAVWLWTILIRGVASRAYNVGSSHALRIAEVGELARIAGGCADLVSIACTPRPGQVGAAYVPDVRRSRCDLGLIEKVSLPDAIRRTMNWYNGSRAYGS